MTLSNESRKLAIIVAAGLLAACEPARVVTSLTTCLIAKPRYTCINLQLLNDSPQSPVSAGVPLQGRSKLYSVTPQTDAWKRLFPDQDRKQDLELFHQSGEIAIEVEVLADESRSPPELAKALFAENGLHVEEIQAPGTAFAEAGSLVGACFQEKDSDDQTCLITGAARVLDRVVRIAMTSVHGSQFEEEALALLASLEPSSGTQAAPQ